MRVFSRGHYPREYSAGEWCQTGKMRKRVAADSSIPKYRRIPFLAARVVKLGGQEVKLTAKEYSLLRLLVQHAGKVLTQRQILKEVWGPNAVEQTHYLRVYMAHLREKLERDPSQPRLFLTESGVGYRLMEQQ